MNSPQTSYNRLHNYSASIITVLPYVFNHFLNKHIKFLFLFSRIRRLNCVCKLTAWTYKKRPLTKLLYPLDWRFDYRAAISITDLNLWAGIMTACFWEFSSSDNRHLACLRTCASPSTDEEEQNLLCSLYAVVDPNIRLGILVTWRIQTFEYSGGNLMCFTVSHVYFLIAGESL